MIKSKVGWLGVILPCATFAFAALAGSQEAFEADDGLVLQASDVSDLVVLGEEDLAERAEILRNQYRRMTPGEGPLVQDVGIWPAAWEEFSPTWGGAAMERDLATWVVPVTAERAGTVTVLLDAGGAKLWCGTTDFAKEESVGVTLTGGLVDEGEWSFYEAAKEEIAMRLEAAFPKGRSGPCTNGLRFTNMWVTTNGDYHFDLAWETGGDVEVFCRAMYTTSWVETVVYTNDENQVVTNDFSHWRQVEGERFNGTSDIWDLRGVVTVTNGEGSFTDTNIPDNYDKVRFYMAAELADSDGDGLTDGHERLVSHTSCVNPDSDGDGIGDGVEAALGFDPADATDRPKVMLHATLYNPLGTDTGKEWIELYSASARTVELGNIRLQVGREGGWETAATFPAGMALAPGGILLLGESLVTNANITTTLGIPNGWTNEPTTGLRLVWGGATNGAVLDTVFIGGGTDFNESGLEETGWLSTNSVWVHAGTILERRFPGVDTDHTRDWHEMPVRPPRNSSVSLDFDDDGLSDGDEWTGDANPWGEPTNPWNADSDGDGLGDYVECITYGTNPNTWATDGDIYPWMPDGTSATNWPGSDSFELREGWNPLDPDENTNGIPDSWEMAFEAWNLDLDGDADGDGIDNQEELQQNSNPRNSSDSTLKPFVLRFESSLPNWVNTGIYDVGLAGYVRMFFEGVRENVPAAVWVVEGGEAEPFAITCFSVAAWSAEFTDSQHALATLQLEAGSRPFLQVKDSGLHPEYENTIGGEHLLSCIALNSVDIEDAPDSGLVVLRGNSVTMHAHIYPDSFVPASGEPQWMCQRRKRDGTWDAWIPFSANAHGMSYTHATDQSGIFRVKAVLHLDDFLAIERMFTRRVDEEHGFGKAGEPDAFGVADTPFQVGFSALAREWLGSTNYPLDGIVPADHGFSEFPAGTYKCNIFVAHRAVQAGAIVPAINGVLHDYPPTANQWAGTESTSQVLPLIQTIDHWVLESTMYPQPGFIVAHPHAEWSGHVGIVDYDGEGIGAGTSGTVNRKYPDFWDGTSGFRRYTP